MYNHGVKPDYFKSMKAAAPPTLDRADRQPVFDHGVDRHCCEGFASVDPEKNIEEINDTLRDHRMKPDYYPEHAISRFSSLQIEQIDSLFDQG